MGQETRNKLTDYWTNLIRATKPVFCAFTC
jgi:hypothetical protein